MAASIESLRASQTALNSAIDRYASVTADSQPDQAILLRAQQAVSTTAMNLAQDSMSPAVSNVLIYYRSTVFVAMRVAIDLNLFNLVESKTTLEELTAKTSADKTLLVRIMRLLVASKHFTEDEEGQYSTTALAKSLTEPVMSDYLKWSFDFMLPSYQALPAFLASTGHNDNTDLSNNVLLKVHGANLFDYLSTHPEKQPLFDSGMRIQDIMPSAMVAEYPYEKIIEDLSMDPKAVTLVDVGGGLGQYLDKVIHDYPHLPGRLILQDTAPVLAGLDVNEKRKFEVMVHDFFTLQSIKEAKFYHLRRVLHDWPDSKAYEILKNLHPACKRGYSKLLIQEWVLPNTNADLFSSMLDLNVMAIAGVERSQRQWETLLSQAGFKISHYWRAKVGVGAIIEAEVE